MAKKLKIAIGVPTPQFVSPDFTKSVIALITTSMNQLGDVLDSLVYMDKLGVRTDRNRNEILKQALDADMDYILWLDTDMVYPPDMIVKYLQHPFDVVGCIYHKRKYPFDVVGYIKGENPIKPFHSIDPTTQPKDQLIELEGIGFGGMMVNMNVYRELGDEKWMTYGPNFHLPFECEGHLTHDLQFCQTVRKHGYKIYAHTGVKPGHLSEMIITEEDWLKARTEERPKIAVLMPTIHPKMAQKTAKILKSRAGMECEMVVIEDIEKRGYVKTINDTVKANFAPYYAYVTDDVFPGRNWLKIAYDTLIEKKAGLCGFNDGKWQGMLATCGLLSQDFMLSNYDGNMFFPEYFGHYNDTELTLMAMAKGKYCYNPEAVLTEIDYEKDTKPVNPSDKALFEKRKQSNFDNKITDEKLKGLFG